MTSKLLTALEIERLTGAPADWILNEAAAGRIPHLVAGSRYLFDLEPVERALRALAGGDGHSALGPLPSPSKEVGDALAE